MAGNFIVGRWTANCRRVAGRSTAPHITRPVSGQVLRKRGLALAAGVGQLRSSFAFEAGLRVTRVREGKR